MTTYTAPPREEGRAKAPNLVRKDPWWAAPATIFVTLTVFIVYSTIRAFMGKYINTYGEGMEGGVLMHGPIAGVQPHYHSPFYSPLLPIHLNYPLLDVPISGALYVLIFPLSFRLSCYYCRKAYYRGIFGDPTACAVPEFIKRKNYTGEKGFPNNLFALHRYALYAAIVLVVFHWIHMAQSFLYTDLDGSTHVGIGLGTLLFVFDTLMLSAYTFSCHSFRHLAGGVLNRFSSTSGTQKRFSLWKGITAINNYHGAFFWLSLISVGLTDFYVWMVSSGHFVDPRLLPWG